jgi:hypothetical protein
MPVSQKKMSAAQAGGGASPSPKEATPKANPTTPRATPVPKTSPAKPASAPKVTGAAAKPVPPPTHDPADPTVGDADLDALAGRINEAHEAGEVATRKSLEHYHDAGEMLLSAKGRFGNRGWWLPWLEKNVNFSQQRASEYMRLARGWVKLPPGGNFTLKEALRHIANDGKGKPPAKTTKSYAVELPPSSHANFKENVMFLEKAFGVKTPGEAILGAVDWCLLVERGRISPTETVGEAYAEFKDGFKEGCPENSEGQDAPEDDAHE